MFYHLRENLVKTCLVLFFPVLVVSLSLAGTIRLVRAENEGQFGAVLDDTWIHVRFAHHLAAGEGLTYNDGVLTSGATSPLWVLLLAAVFRIMQPTVMQQVEVAAAMSAAGLVTCVLVTTALGWYLARRAWVGLLAGLFVALTGRLIWMGLSGMEITTFAALCLLALWSHVDDLRGGRSFGWRTGILAALATLARPEGYLLALLIGLEAVFAHAERLHAGAPLPYPAPASYGQNYVLRLLRAAATTWRGTLAYLLVAGTYPLVCLLISGHPLPNTFRVKSQLGREWPDLPFAFFWQMRVDYGWLVLLAAGIGLGWLLAQAWWAARRGVMDRPETRNSRPHPPAGLMARLNTSGWVLPLWPVVFVLAVLFMGADRYVVNNSRYVAPAIPFHALLAAVGVSALSDQLAAANRKSRLRPGSLGMPVIAGSVLLVFVFVNGQSQPAQVANDVRQLRTMHLAAAAWFNQVTQPDDLLALNDVGAIVHLTDRPVLDLEGLVSAEVIEAVQGAEEDVCAHDLALMRLMLVQRPTLVAVFPWWYPCMTSWPGALQPYNVFTITGPTVIGGGELVVYWPQWEQWPVQAEIAPDTTLLAADFEQGITLTGYTVTNEAEVLVVVLWWQATAQPLVDYTVFVHLDDADGTLLTQNDRPPQDGQFRTSLWRAGDLIRDVHRVPRPAGDVTAMSLRVGLYPTSGGPNLLRVAAPADQPNFVRLGLPGSDE